MDIFDHILSSRNKMIGEVLSFAYDQCAKLGYAMGFGAMEGLVIYLGLLAIIVLKLFNSKSKAN